MWYTDTNLTESPRPYSPKPFTPSDHPATPPPTTERTPTPEPQQPNNKRPRSPDPWQGFETLEELFGLNPEVTRELEPIDKSGQKRQRLSSGLFF